MDGIEVVRKQLVLHLVAFPFPQRPQSTINSAMKFVDYGKSARIKHDAGVAHRVISYGKSLIRSYYLLRALSTDENTSGFFARDSGTELLTSNCDNSYYSLQKANISI
jgi:hypothetical protein